MFSRAKLKLHDPEDLETNRFVSRLLLGTEIELIDIVSAGSPMTLIDVDPSRVGGVDGQIEQIMKHICCSNSYC